MGSSDTIQAFTFAFFSAVFNGSFAACAKLTPIPVDPVLFTFYNSIGVLLSSLFTLPFLLNTTFPFSFMGIIAGSLYIISIMFSFATVELIGLSVGQGVWGGAAILVSFLCGVMIFGNSVESVMIAFLSLLLLFTGIFGIAMNHTVADLLFSRTNNNRAGQYEVIEDNLEGEEKEASFGNTQKNTTRTTTAMKNKFVAGIACALMVGLFGGAILVPMSFTSNEATQGLAFVPSFGLGSFLCSLIITPLYFTIFKKEEEEPHNTTRSFPSSSFMNNNITLLLKNVGLGILSGILWNLGNICSICAIPRIGYATAYPIMQCSLFFGGLLGIFFFREVQDRQDISVFFMSAVILFAGAILLSMNTHV